MATLQEIWNNAHLNNRFWDQKCVNNYKQFERITNASFQDLKDNYQHLGRKSQMVVDAFGDRIQTEFIDKGDKLVFVSFTETCFGKQKEVLGFHCMPAGKDVVFFQIM